MVVLTLGFATGYSAFSTNITLNAKGNIKQKSFSPSKLKDNVVTSGDGLYLDTTENNRYIYKGATPNNYITFNGNELWRIYSIESDESIKIVKDESIGNFTFDPGYTTSISNIKNANTVVGTRYSNTSTDFCYSADESTYYGCGVWGNRNTTLDSSGINVTKQSPIEGSTSVTYDLPESESYINVYLNHQFNSSIYKGLNNDKSGYQDMSFLGYYAINNSYTKYIKTSLWNIGTPSINWDGKPTLVNMVDNEKMYKWSGKVGLITASEYIRANTNSSCTALNTLWSNTSSSCKDTNYLYKTTSFWTLSPVYRDGVFPVNPDGYGAGGYTRYLRGVYPSLYLNSDIKLKGFGTQNNPYYIVDE